MKVSFRIGAAILAVAKGETVAAPRRMMDRPDAKPRAAGFGARRFLLLPGLEGL
jgi:hypothetical protein